MRRRFLVCYDICDDGRLRRVHKAMKGYGEHLQYSVFICDLSRGERAVMMTRLRDLIQHDADRIAVFDLGEPASPLAARRVEYLGRKPVGHDADGVTRPRII
jgi:CRISPR-associated protein Cas2